MDVIEVLSFFIWVLLKWRIFWRLKDKIEVCYSLEEKEIFNLLVVYIL